MPKQSKLFSLFTLRDLQFKNRIVLSPLCQYQAIDGYLQEWHYRHHARFAAGGLALAIVEATAVQDQGRITHGCAGLWEDSQIEQMRRITDMYHESGTLCGIQLAHAGRRASTERPWDGNGPIKRRIGPEAAWERVGPSPLPQRVGLPVPHELTIPEIETLISRFAEAARRALKAGFDLIEIHGAHGYLIHSFFSPVSNQRSDEFGGTRENRMRFPLAVAKAIREVVPVGLPVFYRVSAVDGPDDEASLKDTIALARELRVAGIDLVDCSSGGISSSSTHTSRKLEPGFQVSYAHQIRDQADIPTMAVGAIIEPSQAETIVSSGQADLIALGRQLMAEPHWPYRAAIELGMENPESVISPFYGYFLERRSCVLNVVKPLPYVHLSS
jgi:2,4-dienoyl-CoA reductase-like NADH-dependent reductase (Old Yellow Enzyme family)